MNQTTLPIESFPEMYASDGFYLGPARVELVAPGRVLLVFPDQQVWATLALALPYQPVKGDTLLAISQQDRWYAIGVLDGKGVTSLAVPGNLELKAPRGDIKLVASGTVEIKSGEFDIHTERLKVVANSASESFGRLRKTVVDSYEITAGSLKAIVRTTLRLRGKRIVQRAEENVDIDGKQVRLG